jgi:hypothetical protein
VVIIQQMIPLWTMCGPTFLNTNYDKKLSMFAELKKQFVTVRFLGAIDCR